jgi:effector-binding domain-containing protein
MPFAVEHSEPKIEARTAQHYVGIRTQIPMHTMPQVIPQFIDETEAWLQEHAVEPVGAPFIRYYVIDMEDLLDIEIGWPIASALTGNERILAGVIPAGRYASLIYTDVQKGIEGNKILIEWAKEQGLKWDAWDTGKGEAFRSRIEIFMDGPVDDPDPAKWRTEVAIKLFDQ